MLVLLLLSIVNLLNVLADTSSTGALISFPNVENVDLSNVSWIVAPAQFGFQQYGGSLEGFLVLPMSTQYHLECDPGEPRYSNDSWANPYIHQIKDWEVAAKYIFVIDRGDCYFVDKVENAQALGASAVVMCDKKPESLFTMWMPEDWEDDIDIPSVLLQEKYCETLLKALGVKNWDPLNIDNSQYPDISNFTRIVARLEWGLPHDDDRVEWELWTSSNDEDAVAFKRNFYTTSNTLDAQNDTVFTPHLYLLDGSHWNCDTKYLPCGRQCSNNGRYCAVDPEFDTSIGLDGLDVVQENLRSLCVWEFDKNYSHPNNNTLWWDYTINWDTSCFIPDVDSPGTTFNENCSYTQMKLVHPQAYNDGEPRLHEFVKECVNKSGGYGYKDDVNNLLEIEMKIRTEYSVYSMPMVRVNEFMIHGKLDCDILTVQECTVLSAICAGFKDGTKPDICFHTPAPTAASCDSSEKDCNGTCFGFATEDRCGACMLRRNSNFNGCVGCDDVENSKKSFNPCGFCISDDTPDFKDYGKDCNGTCNGGARIDDCGLCLSPSSSKFNACPRVDTTLDTAKPSNNNSSNDNALMTIVVIVVVVAFFIVVVSCLIIAKLWKKQINITNRFNSLASTYQMMDDFPQNQENPSTKPAAAAVNVSGYSQAATSIVEEPTSNN